MSARALTLDHVTVDVQRRTVEGRRLGMLRVLDRCCLHVPAGAAMALVGPSGSGKSAVVDLFAGFLTPHRGLATVNAQPINGPAPHRGFVQPTYGLFPWRSVIDTITFSAGPSGVQQAETLIELVGLAGLADRPVAHITPTQRHRVAWAKALAHDPGVLLLDDPFADLAPGQRAELRQDLIRMHQQAGVTMLFATSDLEEAVHVADHIAVLSPRPGRVDTLLDVDPTQPLATVRTVWSALNPPAVLPRAA